MKWNTIPKTSANIIFRVQTDVKRHEECKNVKNMVVLILRLSVYISSNHTWFDTASASLIDLRSSSNVNICVAPFLQELLFTRRFQMLQVSLFQGNIVFVVSMKLILRGVRPVLNAVCITVRVLGDLHGSRWRFPPGFRSGIAAKNAEWGVWH